MNALGVSRPGNGGIIGGSRRWPPGRPKDAELHAGFWGGISQAPPTRLLRTPAAVAKAQQGHAGPGSTMCWLRTWRAAAWMPCRSTGSAQDGRLMRRRPARAASAARRRRPRQLGGASHRAERFRRVDSEQSRVLGEADIGAHGAAQPGAAPAEAKPRIGGSSVFDRDYKGRRQRPRPADAAPDRLSDRRRSSRSTTARVPGWQSHPGDHGERRHAAAQRRRR